MQISVEESPLVSQLQLLRDLTRRKLLNNDTPETDFSHKISLMLEKKKMLEDKLEELQERAKKELQFKTDIIERNHALIVERKKQHEEILAAERYCRLIFFPKSLSRIRPIDLQLNFSTGRCTSSK